MGEIGSTMVGVFTPFLLERLPPGEGKDRARGEELREERKEKKDQGEVGKRGCKRNEKYKKGMVRNSRHVVSKEATCRMRQTAFLCEIKSQSMGGRGAQL